MKKKLLILLAVLLFALARPGHANAASGQGTAMIADVVLVRPICFAATAIGSAFFVLSLPFALASGSVDDTAEALVVVPAKATFTRPVGDFEALE